MKLYIRLLVILLLKLVIIYIRYEFYLNSEFPHYSNIKSYNKNITIN